MSREKEAFRDILDSLNEMFPNCNVLNMKQAACYLGMDYRTAKNRYPFDPKTKTISKHTLARLIS